LELGLIDRMISEPEGGAHHDHLAAASEFQRAVLEELDALGKLSVRKLLDARYEKFRAFGEWQG